MALTLHGTVADNTAVLSRQNANPLIINGNMRVKQRGDDITGITTGGFYSIDRMKVDLSDGGTWTHSQDTDNPGLGLTRSWKLNCTTADTSVAANTYHVARYLFEGQDLQLLDKGTSAAQAVTIAFWIKATVTGTYIAELYDVNNDRQISQAYTVSNSNTWEKKVLSFAGDTTGALTNGSSSSFSINLWLSAGSNFTSGTLNTTWAGLNHANRVVGQVNSASSTSNNVYFTGLQMEVGEFDANSIAPFQHESFGDNLARCQRYFQKYTQPPLIGSANANNSVARASIGLFPVQMRAAPTASQSGTFTWFYSNSHQPTSTALAASYTDVDGAEFDITVSGTGMTATHPCSVIQNGSGFLQFEAEL
tara:strand:- start:187 stop:1278 length:1092 start_codon:yes stop_codon:yes gene_type:complete